MDSFFFSCRIEDMLWIIGAFCAFFVKGLCGFANTLVFTSVLSFQTNNIDISPIDLLIGYPSNLIITWKERKYINWKLCLPLIGLVLMGSLPGMLLLKNVDTTIIKLVFGFVVVGIGVEMLMQEIFSTSKPVSRILLLVIGILSGLLCGLFGIGALMSAYISRVTSNNHEFRANMCLVFSVENTFRIVVYTLLGIITSSALTRTLILFPVMFAGLYTGMFVGKVLNEKVIKKIIILMLILSGIILIIKSL